MKNNKLMTLKDDFTIINTDFFNQSKEIYTCKICLNILYKPVSCSLCFSLFCEKCIKDWIKDDANFCPEGCDVTNMKLEEVNNQTKKLLDRLKVKCKNGCEILFTKYFSHLDNCLIEKENAGIILNCWNCNNSTPKSDLKLSNNLQYSEIKTNNKEFRNKERENIIEIELLNNENAVCLNKIKNLIDISEKKNKYNKIIFEYEKELKHKEDLKLMIEKLEEKLNMGDDINTIKNKIELAKKKLDDEIISEYDNNNKKVVKFFTCDEPVLTKENESKHNN